MKLFDLISGTDIAFAGPNPPDALADIFKRANPTEHEVTAEMLRHPVVYEPLTMAIKGVDDIRSAKRLVLDESVVGALADLVVSNPESMLSCIEVTRVPWPLMWVEFNAKERARIFGSVSRFWTTDIPGFTSIPPTLGYLIRSDDDGLRGTATIYWQEAPTATPVRCPISIYFDLEAELPAEKVGLITAPGRKASPVNGAVAFVEGMTGAKSYSDGQRAAIEAIFRHFSFEVDVGMAEYQAQCQALGRAPLILGDNYYDNAVRSALNDAAPEALFFLTAMMLLNAKDATKPTEVTLDKLNKARNRSGKPALLKHDVVTMYIGSGKGNSGGARANGGSGGEKRHQLVRGHFMRVPKGITWRRWHVRGKGGAQGGESDFVVVKKRK